jgi:hypothetical protein
MFVKGRGLYLFLSLSYHLSITLLSLSERSEFTLTDVANQDRRGLENLISSLRELVNDATIQDYSFFSLIKEKAENEGILGCLSEFSIEQLLAVADWLTNNYHRNRRGRLEIFITQLQSLNPASDYISDDPFL